MKIQRRKTAEVSPRAALRIARRVQDDPAVAGTTFEAIRERYLAFLREEGLENVRLDERMGHDRDDRRVFGFYAAGLAAAVLLMVFSMFGRGADLGARFLPTAPETVEVSLPMDEEDFDIDGDFPLIEA